MPDFMNLVDVGQPRNFSFGGDLSKAAFPYFALPKDVRYMILELLLIRGNVALCSDSAIKRRFPVWDAERPQWALRGVNRQMRVEAGDIVFSSRNTFFAPCGAALPNVPGHPWPPVRRLDCAFDIRDVQLESHLSLNDYWTERRIHEISPGREEFDQRPLNERMSILHERKLIWLRSTWLGLAEAIESVSPPLDLLRLDLTNCRCPWACCRLGEDVVQLFGGFETGKPRRIEIVGAEEHEKEKIVCPVADGFCQPLEALFFVHRPPSGLTVTEEESAAEFANHRDLPSPQFR